MTLEERVKQQFPGMFTTLVSVLVGIVLADLVSEAHARMVLWPLSASALRTWAQVLEDGTLAITIWIFFSHLGIARQRVASLLDTMVAFLTPSLLLVAIGLTGRPESWPYFYCVSAFGFAALLVSLWVRYVVAKDPELASFKRLLRPRGYLSYIASGAPAALALGWADQRGWLSTGAETFFIAVGVPSGLFTMHVFVRDWREAIAAASAARAAMEQN